MKKSVKLCSLVMAIIMMFVALQAGGVVALGANKFVDDATGMEIIFDYSLPEDAKILVQDSSDEVYATLFEFTTRIDFKDLGYKNYKFFTATLSREINPDYENYEVLPLEGTKKVSFPIPSDVVTENIEVCNIAGGNIGKIPYKIENNNIVFTTDSAYFYIIFSDKREPIYIKTAQEYESERFAAEDGVAHRVGYFASYSKFPYKLKSLVTDDRIVSVKWTSDNEKITVDENGVVTNTSLLCAGAHITATGYDADGNIVASDTANVVFYKLFISRIILEIILR